MSAAEQDALPPEVGASGGVVENEIGTESAEELANVEGQGPETQGGEREESTDEGEKEREHEACAKVAVGDSEPSGQSSRLWEAASLRGNYGDAPTQLLAGVKIKPLVDKSNVHLREERVAADVLERIMAEAPEKGDAKGWVRLANMHLENASSDDEMVSRGLPLSLSLSLSLYPCICRR